jgi:ribose-phosphate pyrophosphokinase
MSIFTEFFSFFLFSINREIEEKKKKKKRKQKNERQATTMSSPLDIHVPSRRAREAMAAPPMVSPSLQPVKPRGAYKLRIISGTANAKLTEDIGSAVNYMSRQDYGDEMGVEPCHIGRFNDGEIQIQVKNNVRGSDIFIVQPVSPKGEGGVNSSLMELLLLIHTLRLSSAKRITAIVPYFAYARQDRKTKPRVPISASAVAQLIEAMKPDRLVTVDLHCGQIQGFFHSTPVDNLYAENQILEYLKLKGFVSRTEELTIVSPDAGGVGRATRVANKTGAKNIVTILKRRVVAGQVDSMQLVGDVRDQICVIVDDMIDTAGTLCKAAQLLKDNGARQVYAFATHGLLSGPALERINNSCLEEVCVTDSIDQTDRIPLCPKLTVISLAGLLAEAIYRLHNEESLSALFSDGPVRSTQVAVRASSSSSSMSTSPASPSSSSSSPSNVENDDSDDARGELPSGFAL